MNPEDIDKEMYNNFILILSQVVLNIWRGKDFTVKFRYKSSRFGVMGLTIRVGLGLLVQ